MTETVGVRNTGVCVRRDNCGGRACRCFLVLSVDRSARSTQQNERALFLSLEMPPPDIAERSTVPARTDEPTSARLLNSSWGTFTPTTVMPGAVYLVGLERVETTRGAQPTRGQKGSPKPELHQLSSNTFTQPSALSFIIYFSSVIPAYKQSARKAAASTSRQQYEQQCRRGRGT